MRDITRDNLTPAVIASFGSSSGVLPTSSISIVVPVASAPASAVLMMRSQMPSSTSIFGWRAYR